MRDAVESLRLAPVMFEIGARPHPPRALYRAYLEQSHVFLAIYANQYGWVAPTMDISGLEDEFRLSGDRPKLVYVLDPAPEREPQLTAMLADVAADARVRLRTFGSAAELAALVADDLAALLAEPFGRPRPRGPGPAGRDRRQRGAAAAALPDGGSGRGRRRGHGAAAPAGRTPRHGHGHGRDREVPARARGRRTGCRPSFPGGVVLVPLAEVPEPGLVITTIASRTGGPAGDCQTVARRRRRGARRRAGRCCWCSTTPSRSATPPSDLAALISTCPQLTLLVTSRSGFGSSPSTTTRCSPWTSARSRWTRRVRRPGVDPAEADRSAEQSDAVRLFLDRAAAPPTGSRPRRGPGPAQRRRRAVPSARGGAARDRDRGRTGAAAAPTQLLDRLDRSLDLPAARLADLPERQRTLRSTLDWAYDLLAPGEQALLAAALDVRRWCVAVGDRGGHLDRRRRARVARDPRRPQPDRRRRVR